MLVGLTAPSQTCLGRQDSALQSSHLAPETERSLTDAVNLLVAQGLLVEAVSLPDWRELVGLNTPQDLAWAEGVLRDSRTPRVAGSAPSRS